jgi:hypothetical protein
MTHLWKSKQFFRIAKVKKLQKIDDQDLMLQQEMPFVMHQLNDCDTVSVKGSKH